ncbi:replicative DNA helicase [Succinimonas amylolytica]|uniref:replicative DNA helicase n=1 Tax=Succinimonas amylolytica TaxID=83769 RepID=UPI0023A837A4
MDITDYTKSVLQRSESDQDLPKPHNSLNNEFMLIKVLVSDFSRKDFFNVCEIISASDFLDKRNEIIYKVISQLVNENKNVDVFSVGEILNEKKEFKQYGDGVSYLVIGLPDNVATRDLISNAERIKQCSIRRQLNRLLEKVKARNEDPQGESLESTFNNTCSELEEIAERIFASSQGPQDLTRAYFERGLDIRDRQQNPEKYQNEVIPTGYPAIDQILTGGFRKGNLIVIGARPGTGKTTLGLNIAERLIFNSTIKEPVLFFSLEMPFHEITDRFIASVAGIDHSQILNANLSCDDYVLWQNGSEKLKNSNVIFVDDKSNIKPIEIKARASRFKQRRGLSLIVIDYLQYIQIAGYKNRVEELSEISRQLKSLAKDLNVPVIALAQLNRNSENRSDRTPGPADLRGSGSIEQDADIAMFIYRKDPHDQQTEIIVSKNRHGKTGSVLLTFNGQYSRFDE